MGGSRMRMSIRIKQPARTENYFVKIMDAVPSLVNLVIKAGWKRKLYIYIVYKLYIWERFEPLILKRIHHRIGVIYIYGCIRWKYLSGFRALCALSMYPPFYSPFIPARHSSNFFLSYSTLSIFIIDYF